MPDTRVNFVRQQGFRDATVRECPLRYPALMFQPRVALGLVLVGVLGEERRRLPPAPPPRRFAQGLAGTLALTVAASLRTGRGGPAWAVQIFLLLAVSALVFGRFCLGSWLFLHLRGEHEYARRTAPWGEGEDERR